MITLDLSFYWFSVAGILVMLAGQWSLRRVKGLFSRS